MRGRAMGSFGSSCLILALVLFLAPGGIRGQDSEFSLGGGGVVQAYSFSDDAQVGIENMGLFTAPFGVRTTLAERLQVQVFGQYAWGWVTPSGGDAVDLMGLTDTDIQVDYTFGQDAVTLTGVFSLPTGASSLDQEEMLVASAVASDLLPFRISNWGTGGGYALQVAGARRFGGFGAGLSVSYRLAGDFEPLEGNQLSYEPGDELRVRLALDTEIGQGGKGSLVLGFHNFSEDAQAGSDVQSGNVFEVGNRLTATGSYAFPTGGRGAGVLYAGVIHRENGKALVGGYSNSPSQDLVLLGGQFRLPLGGAWLRPRVDGRLFRSEDGVGQGYVAGVGLALEIPGDWTTFTPSVTGRYGNLEVMEGQESSFAGLEAGLNVRFHR